jgi:hypothetical protein
MMIVMMIMIVMRISLFGQLEVWAPSSGVRKKKKKSLTPGWVVYGKRRHAEPPEEDVPPQLYPW